MTDDDTPRYGVCPNGHGDENGIIATEVSPAARSVPNCPICGYPLDHAHGCLVDDPRCVGPRGPETPGDGFTDTCSVCENAVEGRLFVPLSTGPFEWFADGRKQIELRRNEGQYHIDNIDLDQWVELRRGYSTDDSLWGTVSRLQTFEHLEAVHYYNLIVPDVTRAQFIHSVEDMLGQADEYIAIGIDRNWVEG